LANKRVIVYSLSCLATNRIRSYPSVTVLTNFFYLAVSTWLNGLLYFIFCYVEVGEPVPIRHLVDFGEKG